MCQRKFLVMFEGCSELRLNESIGQKKQMKWLKDQTYADNNLTPGCADSALVGPCDFSLSHVPFERAEVPP